MLTCLRDIREPCSDEVKVNVSADRQQRLVVKNGHALQPALEAELKRTGELKGKRLNWGSALAGRPQNRKNESRPLCTALVAATTD